MGSKQTPKSCRCTQCLAGKRTDPGKEIMKKDERRHRHSANQALRQGKEDDVLPATHGARIG